MRTDHKIAILMTVVGWLIVAAAAISVTGAVGIMTGAMVLAIVYIITG